MYLLGALQRVIYNPLDKRESESMLDLSPRELAVLIPLLTGIVWIGVYPKPVLLRMEPAARQFLPSGRPSPPPPPPSLPTPPAAPGRPPAPHPPARVRSPPQAHAKHRAAACPRPRPSA